MRIFGSIPYVHVPDEEAEKCILVNYSDEQKGYKFYNHQTKEVRVSRVVVIDEFALWYLPSPPVPRDSIPISEKEDGEAEMPTHDEDMGTLRGSPTSF